MRCATRKSSRIGTAIPPTPSTMRKSYFRWSFAKVDSMCERSISLSSIRAATDGANGCRRKIGLIRESASSIWAACLRDWASAVSPVLTGFITPTFVPAPLSDAANPPAMTVFPISVPVPVIKMPCVILFLSIRKKAFFVKGLAISG